MKFRPLSVVLILLVLNVPPLAQPANVPGTSDPWLAGMPAGSTASSTDVAPAQSPVEIPGLALDLGGTLRFTAIGAVSNDPCCLPVGPDGGNFVPHDAGAENGIANVVAPLNALVGVFLGASQPDSSSAPSALDFSALGTGFSSLAPGLKQVFFIGDGLTGTGSGTPQGFIIPTGATRLFVGTMDGFEWSNNTGEFTVEVTQQSVPEPTTALVGAAGLLLLGAAARRRITRPRS
jgi:hypothetical protein